MYEDFTHLKHLSNTYKLWIAGDFNLPDINWNNMSVIGTAYPNNMNKFFIDTIEEIPMEQIVDFPTRLDNISSNNKTLTARLLARVITGCHYT